MGSSHLLSAFFLKTVLALSFCRWFLPLACLFSALNWENVWLNFMEIYSHIIFIMLPLLNFGRKLQVGLHGIHCKVLSIGESKAYIMVLFVAHPNNGFNVESIHFCLSNCLVAWRLLPWSVCAMHDVNNTLASSTSCSTLCLTLFETLHVFVYDLSTTSTAWFDSLFHFTTSEKGQDSSKEVQFHFLYRSISRGSLYPCSQPLLYLETKFDSLFFQIGHHNKS